MLEDIIKDCKIYSVKHRPSQHTFEVTWGTKDSTEPMGVTLLLARTFPNHTPFPFLDEQVRIGEQVSVWLKAETELKAEGWTEHKSKSLKSPNSPFSMGTEKRAMLGKAIKAIVGITDKFELYVYTTDGWRFSVNEVRLILNLNFITKARPTKIMLPDGAYIEYVNDSIRLPDGSHIPAKYFQDIKRLMQIAKI